MRIFGFAAFMSIVGSWLFPMPQAAAQNSNYPSRPILAVIPSAQGGGADLSFRVLASALGPLLGQEIIILNKPANSGAEALEDIARAAPDGYTLGAAFNGPLTASPQVRKLRYSLDSFSYVASTFESDYLVCIRKDFPAADAAQLVELVRRKPLGYSYSSEGKGGSGYFAAEGFFEALGADMRSESFNGSSAAAKGFLSGKTDLYFGTAPAIRQQIQNGEVRCPAVLSDERPPFLPDASTPATLGVPGSEAALWRMIIAPKGLPLDRAAKLETAIRKAMESPAVTAFLTAQGERAVVLSGASVAARLKQEYAVNAAIADRLLLATEQPGAPANVSASNSPGAR